MSEAARYGAAAGATAGYYEGIKSGLNYTKSIDNSDRADWKAYRIRYEAELKVAGPAPPMPVWENRREKI